MKLKKIAALALAGVMAVSMLAGCKGNTTTDTTTDTDVEVNGSATGVSAKVDAELKVKDLIELTDNSTYAAWLSKAIQDADLDTKSLVADYDSTEWQNSGSVYTDLSAKFTTLAKDNFSAITGNSAITFTSDTVDKTTVRAGVYTLVGDMTEDVVINKVAGEMNTSMLQKANMPKTSGGDSTNPVVNHKYTGSVSLQKVVKGDYVVWFALVVVEHTAEKV